MTTIVTERSTMGLREVLFSEIDKLRNGEIEPTRAHATAKLAQQILTSVALELNAVRWMEQDASLPANPRVARSAPKLQLVG